MSHASWLVVLSVTNVTLFGILAKLLKRPQDPPDTLQEIDQLTISLSDPDMPRPP